MSSRTIIGGFYDLEKKFADKTFLRQPFGDRWETTTYKDAGQQARKLATGLRSLGLRDKAHIAIVSKNCREWIIADLAIMMAGYVSVPLYPTLTADQISEVLEIGDVDAVFIGKLEVWDKMKAGIPVDMPVIRFPHYDGNSKIDIGSSWDEFMNAHEPLEGEPEPGMDDIWTIVFTSGTTGTPKGVVLKNSAVDSTSGIIDTVNPLKLSTAGDNFFFSYLPLNHIAERVVVEVNSLKYGGTISFSESLARFAKNLSDSRPTAFFAVPRIWTKFQLGVLSKMPQKKLDRLLSIPIVSSMVKRKIQKTLGLDRVRVSLTGAAPCPQPLLDWYNRLGIFISEGYGMTENCAICTIRREGYSKPNSVGMVYPGSELKIDEETGEILHKAPWIMHGYYKDPDKTAETIRDGWLHTGDQGKIDEDGFLFITGRVKDTFKTAKGQFIVPSPIEWKFGTNSDIEQICVAGIGCPQPLALVVPSELGYAKSEDELKTSLNGSLDSVNNQLPNYKRISTIVVMNDPWSVENGLLTPTLKVKRNALHQQYKDQFLSWHEDQSQVVWA